jgi:uncharacterized protein with GYD domain
LADVSASHVRLHVFDLTFSQCQTGFAQNISRANIANKENIMPLFITYASYSQSGTKGLMDNPDDRAEAIGALLEKAGAKLVALYMTTGTHDIVLVSEAADGADAVALGMAVASSGSLSNIETVRAWTSAEFPDIARRAAGLVGNYTPPGK